MHDAPAPPTVALLGGVPASLGGGGLEVQLHRTRRALADRGLEVFHVAEQGAPRAFDVLHAFGGEPDVWQVLRHWRRNPAPLVVSPVIVAAPGLEERIVRIGGLIPWRSLAQRMRAEVVRRADVAVALTEHEGRLVRALGARRVEVVPNGVDAVEPVALATPLPDPYVVQLGTVSARKRQADVVAALAGGSVAPVVVGGFDGPPAERAAFERTVRDAGGVWLSEVSDERQVRALLRGAVALVHLSRAEGQSLAVLEALAEGTPVVASPLPANRELAARHPAHMHLVEDVADLGARIAALPPRGEPRPAIPTWADVAARLEAVYRSLG